MTPTAPLLATASPLIGFLAAAFLAAPAVQGQAESAPDFTLDVLPILVEHCAECHNHGRAKSGLELDSARGLLRGGDRGPLFARTDELDARTGLLWRAVSYVDEELEMPPRGRLPEAELDVLQRWLESGAELPETEADAAAEADTEPVQEFDLAERAQHWAYQPLRTSGDELDIDAHLNRRLVELGLEPSEQASRPTLLRRLSLDLIGLPPSPVEVAEFRNDSRPDAYERQVERLLKSPHFGERWARHWLDLMRYAETRGHEFDFALPNAHEYRDYLIRAFDADVPLDELVREHIAGDLDESPRRHPESEADESILGTGFWFFGDEVHSPVDTRADGLDRTAGKIDTLSKAFLGLTVACARCHDHKFDAITTEDFYALSGYAESGSYQSTRFETRAHNRALAGELESLRTELAPGWTQTALAETRRRFARIDEYIIEAQAWLADRNHAPAGDLDPATVDAWCDHLTQAAEHVEDPLHLLALFSREAKISPRLLELGWLGANEEHWQETSRPEPDLVVDFSREQDLRQNGFAFARRSRGEPVLGDAGDELVREFAPRDAVYFDETWNLLRADPASEGEPGAISWEPSGRMLRTESFILEAPKLFYLVRGAGHAFACVDSHRLVHGPLHATVVQTWDEHAEFRWVEHDLSAYLGHRIHVEFSPVRSAPRFGIAAVAAGSERPTTDETDPVLERFEGGAPDSVAALRNASVATFRDALGVSNVREAPTELLERLNFLLSHPELGEGARADSQVTFAFQGERIARLLDRIRPTSRLAPAMLEGGGVDEHVLIRGSHRSPGSLAPRRFLEVFGGKQAPAAGPGSGRLDLAERLIASPLFPRVQVNRVWHHLFGRGLVPSVDDFGLMGELPSHPELLDELALAFRRDGHSLKSLVRRIVQTDAYRRGRRVESDSEADELDPLNRALHHRPLRRLSAEAIRDSLLAVSGQLDRKRFGAPIPIHLTDFLDGRGRPQAGPLDGAGRRSLYLAVRRNFPVPLFAVFDFPSPAAPVGRRSVSNVPAQALTMMNDPFVWQQAEQWAASTCSEHESDSARVDSMYERAFARPPSERERRLALDFVGGSAQDDVQAWSQLAHALFNTKEFVFVP